MAPSRRRASRGRSTPGCGEAEMHGLSLRCHSSQIPMPLLVVLPHRTFEGEDLGYHVEGITEEQRSNIKPKCKKRPALLRLVRVQSFTVLSVSR